MTDAVKNIEVNRDVKAGPHSVKQGEYQRNTWCIKLPIDHTIEDVLKPDYYANISHMLKPGDKIEFLKIDLSSYAEGIVISSAKLSAKIKLLLQVDLTEKTAVLQKSSVSLAVRKKDEISELIGQESSGEELDIQEKLKQFEVKWNGPVNKFAVFRRQGNARLESNFADKDEAEAWLLDNLNNLVA